MQRPRTSSLAALALVASLGLLLGAVPSVVGPSLAHAQTGVVVLGIRSLEGDDEFARNLTGALRNAANRVDGWSVSDREVTLAQMLLAHGCTEADEACMGQIAASLETPRILYGEVHRSGTGDDFDFAIDLHLFNAESGANEHSVSATQPGERADIDDIREPARQFALELSGAPRAGQLVVTSGAIGATIEVDGAAVGTIGDDGRLVVADVEAGSRSVRVIPADGGTPYEGSVQVAAYGEATLDAQAGGGGGGGGGGVNGLVIGGAVLIGVGAVALALQAWAGFGVLDVANSDDYQAATQMADGVDPDAHRCDHIQARARSDTSLSDLADRCAGARDLEPLQFLFVGLAVAAGGAGIVMLVLGLSADDDDPEAATLQLTPRLGPGLVGLGANGRF